MLFFLRMSAPFDAENPCGFCEFTSTYPPSPYPKTGSVGLNGPDEPDPVVKVDFEFGFFGGGRGGASPCPARREGGTGMSKETLLFRFGRDMMN